MKTTRVIKAVDENSCSKIRMIIIEAV